MVIEKLHTKRMEDNSKIEKLLAKADKFDDQISKLELAKTQLFQTKLDQSIYNESNKYINSLLDELKTVVLNTKNLCLNLD